MQFRKLTTTAANAGKLALVAILDKTAGNCPKLSALASRLLPVTVGLKI
jgi:hypothetical protein